MTDEKEPEKPVQSSGKKKWIFISGGLLVFLAGLSVLGAWAAGVFPFDSEEKPAATKTAKLEVNQMINLQPIVLNLASGRKMAYARIGISLGVNSPTPEVPVIDQALLGPRVTDEILASVGTMTPEELLLPDTKVALKEQIQAFVNGLLQSGAGRVVEVYFTEFIVQ